MQRYGFFLNLENCFDFIFEATSMFWNSQSNNTQQKRLKIWWPMEQLVQNQKSTILPQPKLPSLKRKSKIFAAKRISHYLKNKQFPKLNRRKVRSTNQVSSLGFPKENNSVKNWWLFLIVNRWLRVALLYCFCKNTLFRQCYIVKFPPNF